jgi:DnaJ-class molecular chaperone
MAKLGVCPICNGTGTVRGYNPLNRGPVQIHCHGCSGRGWVTVHEPISDGIPAMKDPGGGLNRIPSVHDLA